jgi:chemotaxis protein CheX
MGKKEPSVAEPVLVANGKKDSRITLGPVLDIRAAGPLRDGLQKALKRGKPVVVDAAQVDRLSTPCIQVLLAASKSAEAGSVRIVLAQASDPFVAAFGDLGLFAALMSWQAEA